MIKIEDHHQSSSGGRRFRMIFSAEGTGTRGTSVWAESLEEVFEALNHYHRNGPRVRQHASDAIHHCPLCRRGRDASGPKASATSVSVPSKLPRLS